ncbi:MAG: cysteine--tRNA ligase [Hormoscilla sp. GM7CHS1pb]|nr:cysteine--tRNA ligase [Hormoscilla sp. GM7CHS1pb]
MSLILYNTLTRHKEPFTPINPDRVMMYCCGVTVYDDCHLGHARSYMVWDVLRRYLQWRGYRVHYVQNFTDIDDKILNRARAEGRTMQAVSDRYIASYFRDIRRLNILDAHDYPRVTEHIGAIHQLIQTLERQGYAYESDGDVYYNVRQFAEYGKLSGRRLEHMQAGAGGRVDPDDPDRKKRNSFDFALWKSAKPGEPASESPWGMGRPGWHIECSAMIRARLGETIDIHGGGGDLVFPHHENEIAQSEAVTGQPLARYWLHNGMVTVGGEKMSKSLGNFTTIRALLDGQWSDYPQPVDPMGIRLFVLQAHYRKPLDFTPKAIAAAEKGWQTLNAALTAELLSHELPVDALDAESVRRFQSAMDDDLNTAAALAVLFELAKSIQREVNLRTHQSTQYLSDRQLSITWQTLKQLACILGLEARQEPTASSPDSSLDLDIAWVEKLLHQRQAARQEKRYAESDRLRAELQAAGITVIDRPGGKTEWHRA